MRKPAMATISLSRFDIKVGYEDNAGPANSLSIGSPGSQRLTIRNRTTMPYDVRATCELPDPHPPRALSYPAGGEEAVIAKAAISGTTSASALQTLDIHGPAASGQRLQITEIEYRLSTAGVPITMGRLWRKITTGTLPFTDVIDVV